MAEAPPPPDPNQRKPQSSRGNYPSRQQTPTAYASGFDHLFGIERDRDVRQREEMRTGSVARAQGPYLSPFDRAVQGNLEENRFMRRQAERKMKEAQRRRRLGPILANVISPEKDLEPYENWADQRPPYGPQPEPPINRYDPRPRDEEKEDIYDLKMRAKAYDVLKNKLLVMLQKYGVNLWQQDYRPDDVIEAVEGYCDEIRLLLVDQEIRIGNIYENTPLAARIRDFNGNVIRILQEYEQMLRNYNDESQFYRSEVRRLDSQLESAKQKILRLVQKIRTHRYFREHDINAFDPLMDDVDRDATASERLIQQLRYDLMLCHERNKELMHELAACNQQRLAAQGEGLVLDAVREDIGQIVDGALNDSLERFLEDSSLRGEGGQQGSTFEMLEAQSKQQTEQQTELQFEQQQLLQELQPEDKKMEPVGTFQQTTAEQQEPPIDTETTEREGAEEEGISLGAVEYAILQSIENIRSQQEEKVRELTDEIGKLYKEKMDRETYLLKLVDTLRYLKLKTVYYEEQVKAQDEELQAALARLTNAEQPDASFPNYYPSISPPVPSAQASQLDSTGVALKIPERPTGAIPKQPKRGPSGTIRKIPKPGPSGYVSAIPGPSGSKRKTPQQSKKFETPQSTPKSKLGKKRQIPGRYQRPPAARPDLRAGSAQEQQDQVPGGYHDSLLSAQSTQTSPDRRAYGGYPDTFLSAQSTQTSPERTAYGTPGMAFGPPVPGVAQSTQTSPRIYDERFLPVMPGPISSTPMPLSARQDQRNFFDAGTGHPSSIMAPLSPLQEVAASAGNVLDENANVQIDDNLLEVPETAPQLAVGGVPEEYHPTPPAAPSTPAAVPHPLLRRRLLNDILQLQGTPPPATPHSPQEYQEFATPEGEFLDEFNDEFLLDNEEMLPLNISPQSDSRGNVSQNRQQTFNTFMDMFMIPAGRRRKKPLKINVDTNVHLPTPGQRDVLYDVNQNVTEPIILRGQTRNYEFDRQPFWPEGYMHMSY